MNEVIQVRMNGWAAMVKARIDSGLTIREWCAANGVSQDAYYYRLRQLRKAMLETVPKQSENEVFSPATSA